MLPMKLLAAAAVFIASGPWSRASAALIYDEDGRKDIWEVEDPKIRELARSVASVFSADQVELRGDTAILNTKPLTHVKKAENDSRIFSLSPGERFYGQPTGAQGSGVLVGRRHILLAGHSFGRHTGRDLQQEAQRCGQARFVFGYTMPSREHDPTRLRAQDVYGCESVEAREYLWVDAEKTNSPAQLEDWALVRLDRDVTDRRPLPLASGPDLKVGAPVFAIGHPLGLPTKYMGGALVRSLGDGFFDADLDAFVWASGSPAFNDRREIEGILNVAPGAHFKEESERINFADLLGRGIGYTQALGLSVGEEDARVVSIRLRAADVNRKVSSTSVRRIKEQIERILGAKARAP